MLLLAMPAGAFPLESPLPLLYRVMAGAGLALKDLQAPGLRNPYATDSRGRLLALPVALATPW